MTTFVCAERPLWSKLFYYDETSPSCLRWKIDVRSGKNFNILKVSAGDAVGCIKNPETPYWITRVNGRNFRVHRIIYELLNNVVLCSKDVIDHLDGNHINNIFSNLRLTTVKGNSRNSKMRSDNTSNVVGVSKTYNGKFYFWKAQWCCDITGKNKSKSFSCNKYGEDLALRLAVEFRGKIVQEMNDNGAGYTNRNVSMEQINYTPVAWEELKLKFGGS